MATALMWLARPESLAAVNHCLTKGEDSSLHRQLGTSCCTSLRNHEILVLQLGIVKETFISLKYLKGSELIVTCLLTTFGVSLACFTDYTYLATHVKNL